MLRIILIMFRTDARDTAGKCETLLQGGGIWNPSDDLQIIHTPVSTTPAPYVH